MMTNDDIKGSDWLNGLQSLQEQGVGEDQVVVLKKKFFVEDANISRDDPVQLHLVYVQSRDGITSGIHPCTYLSSMNIIMVFYVIFALILIIYEESVQFAALQCQIQLGNHNPAVHKPGFLKYVLLYKYKAFFLLSFFILFIFYYYYYY